MKMAPPMMFPIVTGMRLFKKNFPSVKLAKSPALLVNVGSAHLINNPIGTKYIFAILCSKPAATNAVMGRIIAAIFPPTVLAAKVIQTAKQTRRLHIMPNPMQKRIADPLLNGNG